MYSVLLHHMSKHVVHTVILHAVCFLALFPSFPPTVPVSSQLQPALHISLYLLIHGILAEWILPDCICRSGCRVNVSREVTQGDSLQKSAVWWHFFLTLRILTEDNFLDGEVLDLLLVIPSPPVYVCGQSVRKKLGHNPPDTLFGRHASRKTQVWDLQRANWRFKKLNIWQSIYTTSAASWMRSLQQLLWVQMISDTFFINHETFNINCSPEKLVILHNVSL